MLYIFCSLCTFGSFLYSSPTHLHVDLSQDVSEKVKYTKMNQASLDQSLTQGIQIVKVVGGYCIIRFASDALQLAMLHYNGLLVSRTWLTNKVG